MTLKLSLATMGTALLWPCLAIADPCEAPLPRAGTVFTGEVRYVGDGDSLCVGRSDDPAEWIEVRLADFFAPELSEPGGKQAKRALEDLAWGAHLRCVAGERSYDRVAARCTLGGASLGAVLRQRGVPEGGRGRR